MYTHNLDPVLFNFGFIEIRWYSLAYIAGILIGWSLGKKIIKKRFINSGSKFDLEEFDNLITYLILSIIIGGRIGYVIFYNFSYYFSNPLDILKIWEGGMSFHGAMIGVIFGTYIFSIKKKISTFFLLDIIACVSPIGIFFGRIANFINSELVGKVTNVAWGVKFLNYDSMVRHPSQIYEAFFEGIILFMILNFFISEKNYKTGSCSYLFLIYYGIFRILAENFREPDVQVGYLFSSISMGMALSVLMVFSGFILRYFFKYYSKI